jgi:hypothetical protein
VVLAAVIQVFERRGWNVPSRSSRVSESDDQRKTGQKMNVSTRMQAIDDLPRVQIPLWVAKSGLTPRALRLYLTASANFAGGHPVTFSPDDPSIARLVDAGALAELVCLGAASILNSGDFTLRFSRPGITVG